MQPNTELTARFITDDLARICGVELSLTMTAIALGLQVMEAQEQPFVFVIGGAVAGSTAAKAFAARGWRVIVIEQNACPFGKIDDGLPKWHRKLQTQERRRILDSLSDANIDFIPLTKIGVDLSLAYLESLRPNAIVLAVGAWRDRTLNIANLKSVDESAFVYQNPLVRWFNRHEEPSYSGPDIRPQDGAVVIGGGLASIDVAKLINIEVIRQKLQTRGIEVTIEELERVGLPKTLANHKLCFEQVDFRGVTLFYRRGKRDMQLASMDNPSAQQLEKLRVAREKIMDRVMQKYHVHLQEWTSPIGVELDGGQLVGIRARRNEEVDGRLIGKDEFVFPTQFLVSSIGSLPPLIPGLEMEGELYRYESAQVGLIRDNIYALGNVLTGRGNIRDSRKSAEGVAENVAILLGVGEGDVVHSLRDDIGLVEDFVQRVTDESLETHGDRAAIDAFVSERQRAVRYSGSLRSWVASVGAEIDHA